MSGRSDCVGRVSPALTNVLVIRYLSAEQRLNYLVRVDPDGLLRW